jgi:hypothetical protein
MTSKWKLALYYLEVVPEELHLGILKALEEFGVCPLTFQEPAQER